MGSCLMTNVVLVWNWLNYRCLAVGHFSLVVAAGLKSKGRFLRDTYLSGSPLPTVFMSLSTLFCTGPWVDPCCGSLKAHSDSNVSAWRFFFLLCYQLKRKNSWLVYSLLKLLWLASHVTKVLLSEVGDTKGESQFLPKAPINPQF